jgi:hypothetical protein
VSSVGSRSAAATSTVRRSLAHAKGYVVNRSASWTAVRSARRACRARRGSVRICWDLDNTLVDSGSLLRQGTELARAVVEAAPVPNMFAFFDAMAARFAAADHFVLTARLGAMRSDTLAWLEQHAFPILPQEVLLVPFPEDKVRVWRTLARDGELVIVDDLSYGHESGTWLARDDLVEIARRTGRAYVGPDEIARIASGELPPEVVAERVARALSNRVVA